jgi:hypothetical protein
MNMFGRLRNWLNGPPKYSEVFDCGVIKRSDRPIDLKEWNQLVESHAALEQVLDQYGTNPFSNERVLFSGAGVAYCIINGEKKGSLKYFDGKLSITNVPEHFCNEVAAFLQAEVLRGIDAYSSE